MYNRYSISHLVIVMTWVYIFSSTREQTRHLTGEQFDIRRLISPNGLYFEQFLFRKVFFYSKR